MTASRSSALNTHKLGYTQSTCYLVRIDCTDGYQVAATTHNDDITYDDGDGSVTYEAVAGPNLSNVEGGRDAPVGNMEIRGALKTGYVTAADIHAGRYLGAEVRIYEVNWQSLGDGHEWVGPGFFKVGKVKVSESLGTFTMELLSLSMLLRTVDITPRTSLTCRAQFGDKHCKICKEWAPSASPPIGGLVSSVGSPASEVFTDASIAGLYDDHHFTGVILTFSSPASPPGAVDGLTAMVVGYTGSTGTFELDPVVDAASPPNTVDLTPGDTYTPENQNTGLQETGTVTSVANARYEFSDSSRAMAADTYVPSIITWLTGSNAGYSSEVRSNGSANFILALDTPYDIEVGDTWQLTRDCDKQFTTCQTYNNHKNFRGEHLMPVEAATESLTPGVHIKI